MEEKRGGCGGLLGEGGKEAEVLGLVGEIYVCRVGRRSDCGIFVDVRHDGGEGIKVGATKWSTVFEEEYVELSNDEAYTFLHL